MKQNKLPRENMKRIRSNTGDLDRRTSKEKKRREEHVEDQDKELKNKKRESSLKEQLPDEGCRGERIPSGLKDHQPSKEKKSREDHEEKEEKQNKRERSEDEQLPDECCREEKRRRDETDEGAAGPVSAEAQPSRLNPLSISSYNFYSVLGTGGFAKVMLASLGDRRPHVAVKSIRKTKKTKYSSLLTESQVMNIARDSPFLCHGYAAFQSQRHAFYVMEYVSGGSLVNELERYGILPIERVRFISAEIICGLQYLHKIGIIHRDIKPMNILLDHQGHVKICDFGLAKQSVFKDDLTTGWAGTQGYMAPEILKKIEYNAAVDWWSLGITIFEMATCTSPFNDSDTEELMNSVKFREPEIPDWLDEDLKNLLDKLLEKEPKQRIGVQGDIRGHPFYKTIDWVVLEEKGAQPSFKPRTPSPNLFQPYKEKLSFLGPQEAEATSGDSNTITGLSFQSSTWLT